MKEQTVFVDDEIETTIISRGEKGDGVAKYNDFIIFIPESEIKKTYRVKIVKVFNSFGIGEIIEEVFEQNDEHN